MNNENKQGKSLSLFNRFIAKVKTFPSIAHFIRAIDRFNERLGNQFGAAITYFSFLSIIPILMISFSSLGFFLASQPELLQTISEKIITSVNEPTIAATLEQTVNTAINQRATVGLTGLLLAFYSGISWMGNLREAVRAQCRERWERTESEKENIIKRYFRDFISLTGLLIALVLTVTLTSLAGSAQSWLIGLLGLQDILWLKKPLTYTTFAISICANFLMFFWIYWRLPKEKPCRKALMRGSLLAAISFEVLKYVMTMIVPNLVKSPSGAAFGSIIALLAFFYFFARLTLFCAAWIATADYGQQKPSEEASSLTSPPDQSAES